jgi:hypothetical protein
MDTGRPGSSPSASHTGPIGAVSNELELRIDFSEEERHADSCQPIENSLRLLARLLVRAVTAPNATPPVDEQVSLEPGSVSKVRLDGKLR